MAININGIIKMYESGLSMKEICTATGHPKTSIYAAGYRIGYKFTRINVPRRVTIDADAVKSMYVDYLLSENQIAIELGVGRRVIRTTLKRLGVHIRNQSESEAVKWSKMTDQQRTNQVKAANQAIRDKPSEFHRQSSIKQAQRKQMTHAKVGLLESEFTKAFNERGFDCIQQLAVDVYNIDIAIGNTAVEIHINSSNPHNHPFYSKRIVNLLKLDWNVIYIKCGVNTFVDVTADNVSSIINTISTDKTAISKYWMIRGNGDLVTVGGLNGDHLACIDALN